MKCQRKCWNVLVTGIMIFTMMLFSINASAQPEILSVDFFTDNWGPNPLGWEEGHHFVVCGKIVGAYEPEDDNLPTLQATRIGTDDESITVDMPYDWASTTYNFTWFCAGVAQTFPDGGILKIEAIDDSGTSTQTTCSLDDIIEMEFAENISYTYDAISLNILSIKWNPVPDTHRYFIRFYIYDDTDREYRELYDCRSDGLKAPEYDLPNNGQCNVNAYGDFIIRVLSQNYDNCGSENDPIYKMENRSSTWWVSVSPSIIIGECHSGVYDQILFDSGFTMNHLIDLCADDAKNHGMFASCVAALTNNWKITGLISGKEKGAIQSCAAKADIP